MSALSGQLRHTLWFIEASSLKRRWGGSLPPPAPGKTVHAERGWQQKILNSMSAEPSKTTPAASGLPEIGYSSLKHKHYTKSFGICQVVNLDSQPRQLRLGIVQLAQKQAAVFGRSQQLPLSYHIFL